MILCKHPHRRLNILTGEWVLVSPNRMNRPWQGKKEKIITNTLPAYDSKCYLCPGNSRVGGEQNPEYRGPYVFTNDFSALKIDNTENICYNDNIFAYRSVHGICRVICYTELHNTPPSLMSQTAIRMIIDEWQKEYNNFFNYHELNYVQIFENRGLQMGCSNPHPHGQIWASENIPDIPEIETYKQEEYLTAHNSCLLCDYIKRETILKERIIFENEYIITLSPFWAVWPYEVMILPRKHRRNLCEFNDKEKKALADAISRLCIRYDNLFKTDFPYSMGIHQQPVDGNKHEEWHFHIHYYPPLLRSATISKFMVGYELTASRQRDITPEYSAAALRKMPETHYRQTQACDSEADTSNN